MADSLSIVAVGDISLNGQYRSFRFDRETPWNSLEASWIDADFRIGNLEAQITDKPRIADSKFALRAGPTAIKILKNSTFNLLNLANNHAMDFGSEGLKDTMECLDRLGIPYVGCGENIHEAVVPRVLCLKGQKIGFLSFCDVVQISHLYADGLRAGVAPLDDSSLDLVRNLRSKVDWLIVQLHWGVEMNRLPSIHQRATARQFVAAGADAIIGHHPHVVQPMEIIGNTPVWYSLGNFAFSGEFWSGVNESGEQFVGEYKIHPRACQSVVARMTLTKAQRPDVDLQFVVLKKNGTVVVDKNHRLRKSQWEESCDSLDFPNYAELCELEEQEAVGRRNWQTQTGSLMNRLRLKAFQYGMIRQS